MTFHLDLAIVYVCALVLFFKLAAWFVPLTLRALASAVQSWWRNVRTRWSGGMPADLLPHHLPNIRVRALF
jgi:hypothetical protein